MTSPAYPSPKIKRVEATFRERRNRVTNKRIPGKTENSRGLIAYIGTKRIINERRTEIRKEADFYGAMDGASKFVRGDAMAGILITVINIIGGLIIGMAQLNMSATEALTTYTILTVGDGLVSQIPALLISTSAGMIVTRSTSEDNLAKTLSSQLFSKPRASYLSGCVLVTMVIIPGLPTLPR